MSGSRVISRKLDAERRESPCSSGLPVRFHDGGDDTPDDFEITGDPAAARSSSKGPCGSPARVTLAPQPRPRCWRQRCRRRYPAFGRCIAWTPRDMMVPAPERLLGHSMAVRGPHVPCRHVAGATRRDLCPAEEDCCRRSVDPGAGGVVRVHHGLSGSETARPWPIHPRHATRPCKRLLMFLTTYVRKRIFLGAGNAMPPLTDPP